MLPPDHTRADDLGDAAIAARPERSSDRQRAGSRPAHGAALHYDASGSWHPHPDNPGPYGGYRLRPGFKLPPLMFADDEALAITLSLIAAQRQGMSVEPAATAGALAKIERVLPETLRERLHAVRDVVAFAAAADVPHPDSTVSAAQLSAHRAKAS